MVLDCRVFLIGLLILVSIVGLFFVAQYKLNVF